MTAETICKYYDILEKLPMIDDVQEDTLPDVQYLSDEELTELHRQAENGDSKIQLIYGIIVLILEKQELFGIAIKMFEKSADQGDTLAETMMGSFYEYGAEKAGYPRDYRKAFKYYEKAATRGYMRAEYAMGWFHNYIFFYHDYDLALSWYDKALKHGHPEAAHRIEMLNKVGELPTNLVSPGQDVIDMDEEGRKYFYEKKYDEAFLDFFNAACNGSKDDIANICSMMGHHQVSNENINDALKLITIFANYGDKNALSFLAACYTKGEYLPKDVQKGYEYCKKAAENGAIECLHSILQTYLNKQDFDGALKWSKKGYELGDACCTYNLGLAYCNGQGVEEDLTKGLEILKLAKERGAGDQGFPVDGAIEHYSNILDKCHGDGCFGIIIGLIIAVGAVSLIF